MSTHITPPPRADQAGPEAAEPARRPPRFDERGIALQTVIILVVMLAIAGAIAAVLFSRAQEAQTELEATPVTASKWAVTSSEQCTRLGGTWTLTNLSDGDLARVRDARNDQTLPNTTDYCA